MEKVEVRILVTAAGFEIGDTKMVNPKLANELIKNGKAELVEGDAEPKPEKPKKQTKKK